MTLIFYLFAREKMMKIFDAHCDALLKLWLYPDIQFTDSPNLHVSYKALQAGKSKVQCFAIFVPENVRSGEKFDAAIEMIDIFYQKIVNAFPNIKLIRTKNDILNLKEQEMGALLTLEGCDAIGTSIERLRTLIRLGVISVGLTWNHANAVADGVLEQRGAGLSHFGKQVVNELNKHRVWTDVSHLSEKGFWEVIELSDYTIASHSNAYTLCQHPRNLRNEQIKALIEKDGMIGLTFVPEFLSNCGQASIDDILRHLEYVCSLGGERNVGFGSDFDGITTTVKGLNNFREYENLIESLLKQYSEEQTNRFLYQNFVEHLPR
jgi:membrane dipeptidase